MRFAPTSVVVFGAVFAARGAAQPWPITRIADTSTIMPGGTAPFQQFGIPAAEQGLVGFSGRRFSAPVGAGVYRGAGGALEIVVDSTIPIPSGFGNFTGFAGDERFWPSLSGASTAFIGDGLLQRGIYLRSGPKLARVVDATMQAPNSGGATYTNILIPSLEDDRVAFAAWAGTQRGIYRWQSHSLTVVADKSTSVPGGAGTFTDLFDCAWDGDQLYFTGQGSGGYRGLFRADALGQLSVVYDSGTPIPGGSGNFTGLSQVAGSEGAVAFRGVGLDGQEGVYTDLGGSLVVAAYRGMPVPGNPGASFSSFGGIDISGDRLALGASFGGNTGVYLYSSGLLTKVLAGGDALDGRTVFDVAFGRQGLEGDTLAMWVEFTNGSAGIYMATIPAPGAAVAFILPGLLAASRRRRE